MSVAVGRLGLVRRLLRRRPRVLATASDTSGRVQKDGERMRRRSFRAGRRPRHNTPLCRPRRAAALESHVSRITLPILDAVTLTAACTQIVADARAAFDGSPRCRSTRCRRRRCSTSGTASALLVENIDGPDRRSSTTSTRTRPCATRPTSRFASSRRSGRALPERGAVRAGAGRGAATPAAAQLRKDLVESFEDTGVALPPDRRARAKAIAERITALYQEFSRNLRDNQTRLTFTAGRVRGLPEAYLSRQPRDEQGRFLLSFDYPDFNPFMANAEDEEARRRYYIAYLNRGTRAERRDPRRGRWRCAASSPASTTSRATRTSSRGGAWPATPEAVDQFLAEVRAAVEEAERRDVEELRALKAERTGAAASRSTVTRWDVSFLSERLREQRYSVDQESLRKYFPPQATLDWLLDVSGDVFGLRFEPVQGAGVARRRALLDVARRARTGASSAASTSTSTRAKASSRTRPRGRCAASSTRAGRTPISVLVDQLRPPRPHARRGRDALPRVRPRAARRALGDPLTTSTPARACSATSSRRPRRSTRNGRAVSRASHRMRAVSPETPVMDAATSSG